MTLNFFMTQRIFCFRQYDRIDDFIPCNLRGDKCLAFRKFLVDEFHFSAVFEFLKLIAILGFGCDGNANVSENNSKPVTPHRSDDKEAAAGSGGCGLVVRSSGCLTPAVALY
jgi:hypothetical protein